GVVGRPRLHAGRRRRGRRGRGRRRRRGRSRGRGRRGGWRGATAGSVVGPHVVLAAVGGRGLGLGAPLRRVLGAAPRNHRPTDTRGRGDPRRGGALAGRRCRWRDGRRRGGRRRARELGGELREVPRVLGHAAARTRRLAIVVRRRALPVAVDRPERV